MAPAAGELVDQVGSLPRSFGNPKAAFRLILYGVRTAWLALMPALSAAVCPAQSWEIGAGAGYGIYRNASVWAPAGVVTAGVRNRFVVTAVLGEDRYPYVSGELRYTYQDGDPFLQAGSVKANVQGQSHAFHYDVLVHTRPDTEKLRPFVAVGAGAKLFHVSGPENPYQALSEVARLRANDELRPLITGGGGLKIRISDRILLRLEFRDYITPFPKQVIQPAPFGTARGILHQFTPMIGVSLAAHGIK
jgi:hypothetical protein